ncbi:MAG: pyridoxal-phosphate dependent enzyme, partial [Deltaproteobacteria bacterium]
MFANVLEAIGRTPLVRVNRLNPNPNVTLAVKLEGLNPGGSVKDRIAYWMIKGAIERGELTPGKRILEPTSGNTGIGLAMVGAVLEIPVTVVMP